MSSSRGLCVPPPATYFCYPGQSFASSVTNPGQFNSGTQQICTGWTGTGSVPANGDNTNVTFIVTNHSTLTWTWRTNHWLQLTGASCTFDVTNGWHPARSTVNVTATPLPGAHFWEWKGDTNGCTLAHSHITIPMDRARSIIAHFTYIFYVNDSSTNLDEWCTATGSSTNDGLTPDSPKNSVMNVIQTYDLEPGDLVRIDAGTYLAAQNITLTSADEGSGTIHVQWNTGTNAWCFVERHYGPDLISAPDWHTLVSNPPAAQSSGTLVDSAGSNEWIFYRIRLKR